MSISYLTILSSMHKILYQRQIFIRLFAIDKWTMT